MVNETFRITCQKFSSAIHAVHDAIVPQSVELESQLRSQEEFTKAGGAFLMDSLEQQLVAEQGQESVRRTNRRDRNYPYWYRDIVQFDIELAKQEDGTEQWVGRGVSVRASFLGRVKVDLTSAGQWESLGCYFDNLVAKGYDGKPPELMSLSERVQFAKNFARPVAVSLLPHLGKTSYK